MPEVNRSSSETLRSYEYCYIRKILYNLPPNA